MSGMNRNHGTALAGLNHIRQSITDILTTPIGSRVMRRDYGSLLPELIDQPLSGTLLLQVYAATVMAIARWEPRVRLVQLHRFVSSEQHGQVVIDMEFIRLDTGTPELARLEIELLKGGYSQ